MEGKFMSSPLVKKRPITPIDVSSVDLYVKDQWREPFAELRANMPISFRPDSPFGPYWSVVTYDLVKEVEGNPDVFSSSYEFGGITIEDLVGDRALPNFISMDGKAHTDQRMTVMPAFNREVLIGHQDQIRHRTRELLSSLPSGQAFDWVSDVSTELTITMLAILLDFPWEERHDLRRWSDWAGDIRPESEQTPEYKAEHQRQLMEMLMRFEELLAEHKSKPPTSGLLSRIIHSEAMGNQPPIERLANLALLIVGGNDTTRNSMSAFAHICAMHPEHLVLIRNEPDIISNATQEVIRWQSPVTHMRRTATRDFELAGQKIQKGEKVILWYISANRDESVFENSESIDFKRANARRHLSFGYGPHRCVGARLAELQLSILFEELANLSVKVELAGEPEWGGTPFLHIYDRLPVRLIR